MIVQVQAVDGDAGVGNAVTYEIISGKCDSVYSGNSLRRPAFVEKFRYRGVVVQYDTCSSRRNDIYIKNNDFFSP